MSVKRRDKKNRVLRNGESQRADGRYAYKYVDIDGKAKFVYSWKLVETDRLPQGKHDCISLREQEKEIQKRLDMNVSYLACKMKLIDCFEQFINNKVNVKKSTQYNYECVLNVLKKEDFCQLPVSEIKISNVKKWFIRMNESKGYSRLNTIKTLMSAMFDDMIESELVVKNPFNFNLSNLIRNDRKKRESLSKEEENNFLNFLQNSKYSKYYDEYYFLLNTGLRIGEFCGLTLSDIDFENRTIDINHQLLYIKGRYHIGSTKSEKGNRKIPITDELEYCLKNLISKRKKFDKKCVIDGKTDFLFLTCHNSPTNDHHWRDKLTSIVNTYNKNHTSELPTITPHILRHTYCSNLIKSGVSPKTVQYLMGHSDIQVTMNIYTHIKYDDVKSEILGD